MVLARENNALQASRLHRRHDLIWIKIRRVEDVRILIAGSPLFVRECIHAEVQKSVSFHPLPAELASTWECSIWRRSRNIPRVKISCTDHQRRTSQKIPS